MVGSARNSRKGTEHMKIKGTVGGKTYGRDSAMIEYQVRVRELSTTVEIQFENDDKKRKLKRASLSLPRQVAIQLGHALLLASAGYLDADVAFSHDEASKR